MATIQPISGGKNNDTGAIAAGGNIASSRWRNVTYDDLTTTHETALPASGADLGVELAISDGTFAYQDKSDEWVGYILHKTVAGNADTTLRAPNRTADRDVISEFDRYERYGLDSGTTFDILSGTLTKGDGFGDDVLSSGQGDNTTGKGVDDGIHKAEITITDNGRPVPTQTEY